MDAPLPPDIAEQLRRCKAVVDGLEAALRPFPASPRDIAAQFPPLERAQAHLALAQAGTALMHLLLRLRGVDPEERGADKEARRLAQYKKKVSKAVAEEELRVSRPALELNVAAMARFIAAAVPDLSADQRQALKQAGKAARDAPADERRQSPADHKGAKDAAIAFLAETLAEVPPAGAEESSAGRKRQRQQE